MKVKIGNIIYDASEQPIMLILDDNDKKNISNMAYDAHKYCEYPDNMSLNQVKEFMRTKEIGNITDG